MNDEILLLYRRIVFSGLLIISSLFILYFILSSVNTNSSQVRAASITPADENSNIKISESPNAVTNGLGSMLSEVDRFTGSVTSAIGSGMAAAGSATVASGKFIVSGVGDGLSSAGHAVGSSAKFVFNLPGTIVGSASDADVLSSVIRPEEEHLEIPIIDPNSPELQAAIASLPPSPGGADNTKLAAGGAGPAWPIHGRITTEFGVYHRPYQLTHTGMDISDGKPAGTTPVKPFRSGKVIEVIHSKAGLGNHVMIDHGNGVTSVYAHLNSISVSVGQDVALDNTIGFVGTTGVSTGPHLHFEIRVNGKVADPRKFINGLP